MLPQHMLDHNTHKREENEVVLGLPLIFPLNDQINYGSVTFATHEI